MSTQPPPLRSACLSVPPALGPATVLVASTSLTGAVAPRALRPRARDGRGGRARRAARGDRVPRVLGEGDVDDARAERAAEEQEAVGVVSEVDGTVAAGAHGEAARAGAGDGELAAAADRSGDELVVRRRREGDIEVAAVGEAARVERCGGRARLGEVVGA